MKLLIILFVVIILVFSMVGCQTEENKTSIFAKSGLNKSEIPPPPSPGGQSAQNVSVG